LDPRARTPIDGQRAATAAKFESKNDKFDKTLSKALRHALSLQKTGQSKAIAAALNGFLSKLNTAGLDLNDVEVVVRASAAKQKCVA
jgi:hypothetical protein